MLKHVLMPAQTTRDSYIAGLIGSDGTLQDVWVWKSAGLTAFDQAAITSFETSQFVPQRAFCQTIPSIYLFRAEFRAY